ncbi:hypothetical protein [Flavobacterium nackdongense]|uniref:DUF4369 domain-containing protein n=1 Tax=Flavobacterium nackdongense TaxID=2547394 RepID=A0A4P6YFY2_9FLAO|nr:hypothetical protein [Flavobacterium nackdongense]QBN19695.1 hypothetical protein E1750_13070 [Flavobacterium nackdongense]
MKKVLIIVFSFFVSAFFYAQNKRVMNFEGEIINNMQDILVIETKNGKEIMISKDGVFKDTINTTPRIYNMWYGKVLFHVFFKNDFNLALKMNSDSHTSLVFSGKGAAENNFLTQNPYYPNPIYFHSLLSLNKGDFLKEIKKFKSNLLKKLKTEDLDPDFNRVYKDYLEYFYEKSKKAYNKKKVKVNL